MVRTGIPDALSGIRLLCVMGVNGDGCGDGGACPLWGKYAKKRSKQAKWGRRYLTLFYRQNGEWVCENKLKYLFFG